MQESATKSRNRGIQKVNRRIQKVVTFNPTLEIIHFLQIHRDTPVLEKQEAQRLMKLLNRYSALIERKRTIGEPLTPEDEMALKIIYADRSFPENEVIRNFKMSVEGYNMSKYLQDYMYKYFDNERAKEEEQKRLDFLSSQPTVSDSSYRSNPGTGTVGGSSKKSRKSKKSKKSRKSRKSKKM